LQSENVELETDHALELSKSKSKKEKINSKRSSPHVEEKDLAS